MTEINIPLLRKAVEWVEAQELIEQDKRQWRQNSWVVPEHIRVENFGHEEGCGTAYCVAGYIGMLVDERFVDAQEVWDSARGGYVHVTDVACKALGIEFGYEGGLFSAGNSAADVRRKAEKLAGEKL